MPFRDLRKAPRLRLHDPEKVSLKFKKGEQEVTACVFDYSRFGLGLFLQESPGTFKAGGVLEEMRITAGQEERHLGEGRIARAWRRKDGLYLGVFLNNEFIDMDALSQSQKIVLQEDELKNIFRFFALQKQVSPEFKIFTAKFAFGLGTFQKSLDAMDRRFKEERPSVRKALFNALTQGLGAEFFRYMDDSLQELKELVAGLKKREHEQNGLYLRRAVWPYLMESPFIARANLKPRGYAGDSAMMEMCYRNDYEGAGSFGKLLHKHPVEHDAAEAVRYRRRLINKMLVDFIQEKGGKKTKVLSIACGPAWEMKDFFQENQYRENIELVLLDQDESALAEARANIESVAPGWGAKPHYLRDSVRTLLKTADPAGTYGQFDFIYSMGLFDYLTQPVARAVFRKLYDMTASGGKTIVGNYHVSNPSRYYMEYLLDWVLIYRDEEDMNDLASRLESPPASVFIGYDDTKSQMYLETIKA